MKSIFLKSLLLTALLFTSNNVRCEQQNIKSIGCLNNIVYSRHHIFDAVPDEEKKSIRDLDVTAINDILSSHGTDVTRTDDIWSAVNKLTDTEVSSKMIEILSHNSKKIIDKGNEENSINLKYYDNFNTSLYSRYLLKRMIRKYESNSNTITNQDKIMFYKNIGRNLSPDDYSKMDLIIKHLVNIFCDEIGEDRRLTIELFNTLKFCDPGYRNLKHPFLIHNRFTKNFIMGYIDIARYDQDTANRIFSPVFDTKVNTFQELLPILFLLGFEKYNTEYGYNDNYEHVTWRNFVIDNMRRSDELYVQEFNKARSFINLDKLQKICNTIILTINELFQDKLIKSNFNKVKEN